MIVVNETITDTQDFYKDISMTFNALTHDGLP